MKTFTEWLTIRESWLQNILQTITWAGLQYLANTAGIEGISGEEFITRLAELISHKFSINIQQAIIIAKCYNNNREACQALCLNKWNFACKKTIV